MQIQKGDVVLVVEDNFTTGRLPDLVDKIARDVGAIVLPYILTFANLSGREASVKGKRVASLVGNLCREPVY